jgi:dienelactone hydrolase
MRCWLVPLVLLLVPGVGQAEVVTRPVDYRNGRAELSGLLVYDDQGPPRRPAVLVAHPEGTAGAQARQRATYWARLGYVAFLLDLYGPGPPPKDAADAAARLGLAGPDRSAVRARCAAGLAAVKRVAVVDPGKVAAVGYGVGGTAVLELARSGADLEGVAALHPDLNTSRPDDAKRIKADVFVVVGTDDPRAPAGLVATFDEEMRAGGVDWRVLRLGGVAHDFTNPAAGRDLTTGAAYDAVADRRAADAVESFLEELFPKADLKVDARPAPKPAPRPRTGVPDKVAKVLAHIDRTGEAPDGYEGGRRFGNFERLLPERDARGRPIRYREWDVNPLRPGVNRGAERLVTGSDGSAHYTADHYRSFTKIR